MSLHRNFGIKHKVNYVQLNHYNNSHNASTKLRKKNYKRNIITTKFLIMKKNINNKALHIIYDMQSFIFTK